MKNIIKNILLFSFGAVLFCFVACDDIDYEVNYNILAGDTLYSPATGTSVDLTKGSSTIFTWAPSVAEDGGYVLYDVLFDTEDGDFSNPISSVASSSTGSATTLTLTAKELNNVMSSTGVGAGETGTIKWTVRASKGLHGSIYSESNLLSVTRLVAMDPLPTSVTISGDAAEAGGIDMVASAGIDGESGETGVFECFTQISSGSFYVTDDQGRYYTLSTGGLMKNTSSQEASSFNADGIYWITLDFTGMSWTAVEISKIEFQASAWGDRLPGYDYLELFEMDYQGGGTWALLDYANEMSLFLEDDGVTTTAGDSRHKFKITTSDGVYYGGTSASLGTSYTTSYLTVNLYTSGGIGNTDWDMSWYFLDDDCGRELDCYLYLNADNDAGTWYHEYIF